jgi:hypothetical protein
MIMKYLEDTTDMSDLLSLIDDDTPDGSDICGDTIQIL